MLFRSKAKAGSLSKGGGRPKSFDQMLWDSIQELKKTGVSNRIIASELKVSASTVSKYLRIE